MAHPVTWFQISGKDDKPLVDFYKKIFGWRMQSPPGQVGYHMVEKVADGIAGGIGAAQDGNPSVTVYINVDDLGKALQKIEAAGGKTAMPPMELPDGMGAVAGFIDPAGNWVGIWEPGKGMASSKQANARTSKKKAPAPASKKKAPAPASKKKKQKKKKSAPRASKKKAAPRASKKQKKKSAPRASKKKSGKRR